MPRFFIICSLLIGMFFFVSCSSEEKTAYSKSKNLSVLTTVDPIADLVEKIGGTRVEVSVLVPAGREPETFTPSPMRIAELTKNRLFFRVGLVSEETFLPKLQTNAPDMKIVDLREGVALLEDHCGHDHADHDHSHHAEPANSKDQSDHAKSEDHADHDHADHEHSDHDEEARKIPEGDYCGSNGMDPHIWMSPEVLKGMIVRIAEVLSEMDPEGRAMFEKNRDLLDQELIRLQKEIHEKFKGLSSKIILVFHPAYGYFCREFGLEQLAIETGGKAPRPQDLVSWITTVNERKLKKIIVQPEFNRNSAKAIVDPLKIQMADHSPLKKDVLESIRELAEIIEK
ncbi:MAG: zinc ABC transporter substrate-binding protein [Planctomycetia bacterium]|nr:zinc ABC transporter substrate-binding protein [Planctomycetia bacterium]